MSFSVFCWTVISAFLSIVKFKQQHFNLASPLKLNWHEFMWWPYFVVTDLTEIYMIFKDQIILAPGRWILAGFWVPHEIENCNFQNLVVFPFPETSQNLIPFIQLLFSLFQRGDSLEKSENPRNLPKYGPQFGAEMIWSFRLFIRNYII